jgi:hypothetical protein
MEKESPEFYFISEEEEGGKRVRHLFRIPVSDQGSVQVLIKQETYPVSNVNQGGIGIDGDHQPKIILGEILEDCELIFPNTRISGLTGKVIHSSSVDFGPTLYGIGWMELTPGQTAALNAILSKMKVQALENNDRNIDSAQEKEE